MEKVTTTLLTGAAISALSVVPATAGAHHFVVHGLAAKTAKGVIFMNKIPFKKTLVPGKTKYNFTCTYTTHGGCYTHSFYTRYRTIYGLGSETFAGGGAASTWYKVTKDLPLSIAWESGTCTETASFRRETCNYHDAKNSKWKGKASFGKVGAYSSSDHYTTQFTYSTGFVFKEVVSLTFKGPAYNLKHSSATSDGFTWNNSYHSTYTYSCTNSKGKHKMCKEEFIGTAKVNNALSFD